MIDGVGRAPDEGGEVGVALRRDSGLGLVGSQRVVGLGLAEPSRQMDATDERVDVGLLLQVVAANDRRRQRVGGPQPDVAARLRLHQRNGDGDEAIGLVEPASDIELNVRRALRRFGRHRRSREHAGGDRRARQRRSCRSSGSTASSGPEGSARHPEDRQPQRCCARADGRPGRYPRASAAWVNRPRLRTARPPATRGPVRPGRCARTRRRPPVAARRSAWLRARAIEPRGSAASTPAPETRRPRCAVSRRGCSSGSSRRRCWAPAG